MSPAIGGPVLIVGTGLIGTSIALSLRRAGVEALLSDPDAESLRIAVDSGAGRPLADGDEPVLVVVAVPPRHAALVLALQSARFPLATITDVTSVKHRVVDDALSLGADPVRLVGGHPMAGREVSGAAAARVDLLDDRIWVVTPLPENGPEHVRQVNRLVSACGAYPVTMGLAEHDAAVALVSHAPHVLSSALAGRLVAADDDYVRIAGQGLRDMTRIAASQPALWIDILGANAGPVADELEGIIGELQRTVVALRALARHADDQPASAQLEGLLGAGVAGQARIPGKHGAAPAPMLEVAVMLADRPGELARLFTAAGRAGINFEDVRIEHVLGRPSGIVGILVRPEAGDTLLGALRGQGFDVRS
jgi:prephenate dehydrogenase